MKKENYILWFKEIEKEDVPLVGGKNASLGEMFSNLVPQGINIPDGFALTASAFWYYLEENKIGQKIKDLFEKFDPQSLDSLKKTGKRARKLILNADFPSDLRKEILRNYQKLSKKYGEKELDVAVRSSATAEDLPGASFAGQHETSLNVGGGKNLLQAIKKSMASLFTNRAIAYREEKGFGQTDIALSVGIQKMVRSDLASAGVIFTLDTESGFRDVVLINSVFGTGDMVVKGKVTPDQFYVFKPTLKKGFKSIIAKNLGRKTKKYIYRKKGGLKEVKVSSKDQLKFSLTNKEILTLAQWGILIENHYELPQDIEWAKDGKTGKLFVVQSRPETVHAPKVKKSYKEYSIESKEKPILEGIAIGNKIGQGKVRIIPDISQAKKFKKGEVLVTEMTDPDWLPLMRIASAIITEEGGKTAHAAIVSRELGLPCIVGASGATSTLKNGQEVTLDCTGGLEGKIYSGKISYKVKEYNLDELPDLETNIMVNIGAPEIAFQSSFLPVDGVGLAREEFIIAEKIRVHPLALYHFKKLKNGELKKIDSGIEISKSRLDKIVKKIDEVTRGYSDKKEFFIHKLAEGIAKIGAAFYPNPVIVRFSDFKTNEYQNLVGGELFEKEESNPMLGFRGACRYLDKQFQPAFGMECRAIKKVREEFGLKNVWTMIPFCRTPKEGERAIGAMKKFGLKPHQDGLKVMVMCEIPSNVILANAFLDIFDGMSIGSNDLTQLTLGMDRDNAQIAHIGDERNAAIKKMIRKVVMLCNKRNKYCGICGEAPSIYKEFAKFLLEQGIESISLNPHSVIKTLLYLGKQSKT